MVEISLNLIGSNGDTIRLDGSDGFVLERGFRGAGLVPADVRVQDSAGDGAVWRSSRRTSRELDLPILVAGSDREQVQGKLRRLAAVLSDRIQPPRLQAVYSDGEGPFDLVVHYTAGGETTFGEEAGATFCRWPITVTAPDPYWVSQDSESSFLGSSPDVRGLLPRLHNLPVKSSQVIGEFTVENRGDVDSFPVWTFRGPIDEVTVTSAQGQSFSYVDAIGDGETITIDTLNATVVDQDGVNKYASLGASPKLFAIPAGVSTVNVEALGTVPASAGVAGTLITCSYRPRREVIY